MSRVTRVREEYEIQLEPLLEVPLERRLPLGQRLWQQGWLRKGLILALLALAWELAARVQGNDLLLFSRALLASRIYWVNPVELERPRRLRAKVRYRQSDQDCVLEKTAEGYRAVFDEPQRAVTPGQSVVFYDGDVCLGGGVIETAEAWDFGGRP